MGIDGEGVKVGVIDGGFDLSNPEIADNIANYRSFTGDISPSGSTTHGTAVSEIVVDTAPNSSLYLTNARTQVEFANAVDWLRQQNVDIISMSMGWNAQPYDGSGQISQTATTAVNDGILFVTSAGNSAERHWEGPSKNDDGDEWLEFNESSEANTLNEGEPVAKVRLFLSWDDWDNTDTDYDLYLWQHNPSGDDQLAAKSARRQSGTASPYEVITGSVSHGVYYVTVRHHSGPISDTLDLYTSSPPRFQVSKSSLTAPATAVNVTSVGAYNYDTKLPEPYSSQGPTNDGRRGVDVTGPDRVTTESLDPFAGTSAATPHVAGVAALLLGTDSTLTQPELKSALRQTATDSGPSGIEPTTGYGQVDAFKAFRSLKSPANVSILDTSFPAIVNESLHFNVSVTLENTGERTASDYELKLFANGAQKASKTVDVDQGTETHNLSIAFAKGGQNHSLSANEKALGTVYVRQPATFDISYQPNSTAVAPSTPIAVTANVSNTGDLAGNTEIEFFADGVAFANKSVRVAPGNRTEVEATTAFTTLETHNLTVESRPATAITVNQTSFNLSYSVSERTVERGENLSVTAVVRNTGPVTGEKSLTFAADGTVFASPTLRTDPGKTLSLTRRTQFATTGTHSVHVNTRPQTSIAVKKPGNLSVSYRVSETQVDTLDNITLNTTVSNSGGIRDSILLSYTADGRQVTNRSASVGPGNTTTLSVNLSFATAGTYNVTVNDSPLTTLTVKASAPTLGNNPAQDLDGDGRYEDVDGDGSFNIVDVQLFFIKHTSSEVQNNASLFDFTSDGNVNIVDIQALFVDLQN